MRFDISESLLACLVDTAEIISPSRNCEKLNDTEVNLDVEENVASPTRLDKANAIRALAMDAVQAANSGHPGMPMGMADIAEVLWCDFLKHNPANPQWCDRDRFVLSNGHGSMLIYALLHLTGYDLPIDEIRRFRQLHSKTPGHPEYGLTPGVETTTGPLAQGLANAVGFALAEKVLAARFNRLGHKIVDHHTYVFVGDGCLMEGVSHEVASFAGTHQLNKLIVFYDDNNISIDGEVAGWFTDNTPQRFAAYGWHVIADVDGHDPNQIRDAIDTCRQQSDRPSIICCKTVIGWGSPNKRATAGAHGAPLGEQEVALAREELGWHYPAFEVPDSIYAAFDNTARGIELETSWNDRFKAYQSAYPQLAEEFQRRIKGEMPADWANASAQAIGSADSSTVATRQSSRIALNAFGPLLPEIIGGSADLTGSNLTFWEQSKAITGEDAEGNYIFFGVREFGMTAIVNGLALHGGFIPYGATFLMFSEYARNAVRMAALMGIQSILVYTHDSIGLGEDGPTHQAVEQAATLRLIPNMSVWRPCDTQETLVAWKVAIERKSGPTSLLLSRQGVPQHTRSSDQIRQINQGGYVLIDCEGEPEAVVIATGSEVGLAVSATEKLTSKGIRIRVVSMPSINVFETQSEDYRNSVIPPNIVNRVIVEAGVTALWAKYAGAKGIVLGVDSFGESAPAKEIYQLFNLTDSAVEQAVLKLLN